MTFNSFTRRFPLSSLLSFLLPFFLFTLTSGVVFAQVNDYNDGLTKMKSGNHSGAIIIFKKIAKQSNNHLKAKSYYHLGEIYRSGERVFANKPKANEYYLTAYKNYKLLESTPINLDGEDFYFMGNLHYFGFGISRNIPLAIKYYFLSSEKEFPLGRKTLRSKLRRIKSREPITMEIINFLNLKNKATRDDPSKLSVAKKYYEGIPTLDLPPNHPKALDLLLELNSDQYPEVPYLKGVIYSSGGIPYNYPAAKEAFLKSIEFGNLDAIYNMGLFYENGYGVAQDEVEAVRWYRNAAAQNHLPSIHKIGLAFKDGKGVLKDHKTALDYFLKSSQLGYPLSRCEIAELYVAGERIVTNYKLAKKFANLGFNSNDKEAQKKCFQIYTQYQLNLID